VSEEERNGLIKQRRLLREKCKEKDKEIERLREENVYFQREMYRNKNVINEIESILYSHNSNMDKLILIEEVLDKFKENK
jgi:hypothetical protein